jgi:murein DD-endopeptidase MepM/ murein hydrolase activator NlpD
MGKHSRGGPPTGTLPAAVRRIARTLRRHRGEVGGKIVAALVAPGALTAIGQPLASGSGQRTSDDDVARVHGSTSAPAIQLLAAEPPISTAAEQQKIQKSETINRQRAARAEAARKAAEAAAAKAKAKAEAERRAAQEAARAEAARRTAEEAAQRAEVAKPAEGVLTSGYGARWGSTHQGIDIANEIGTPVRSAAAGEVITAGPASGFGLWVRVQHDDGTITVYGHVNTIDVSVGERVAAGEQIATMGNRGQSTGPHLHFEVLQNGSKVNPLSWLEEHGVQL